MINGTPTDPTPLTVPDLPFAQVVNADGQPETLHLDLYLPAEGSEAVRPAIFWFHGGGFRPGNDRRQVYIPRFARAFAARGYVGIAPDYRVRANPDVDWPGTTRDAVEDGRAALNWVREHADEYGIDTQRMALAGGSAGAMLATNLCHDPCQPIYAQRDGIRALISLWGPPVPQARLFPAINPYAPPTWLAHGTADAMVPYQLSVDLAAELRAAGVRAELLTLPDAPHTPLMHFDQLVEAIERFLTEVM